MRASSERLFTCLAPLSLYSSEKMNSFSLTLSLYGGLFSPAPKCLEMHLTIPYDRPEDCHQQTWEPTCEIRTEASQEAVRPLGVAQVRLDRASNGEGEGAGRSGLRPWLSGGVLQVEVASLSRVTRPERVW